MRKSFWFIIEILFALLLTGAEMPAQSAATVNGVVQDSSGAVIVHATASLLDGTGAVRQAETGAAGEFRIAQVKPGTYKLTVSAEGFRDKEQDLIVPAQGGRPLLIQLSVMAAAENVSVSAEGQIPQVSTEMDNNQNANEVDRDALDRLPVFDGDYMTTLSRFLSPDATGTFGVSLVVNGVQANGPGVTASGIQSVKINQNPYTALYSAPGRARIEITTKSGTEQFHGSGNFLFRNSVFDAKNAFAETKPVEQRVYFEGALTGPLHIARRTTFLLSANHDSNHQQAIVVAATPEGEVRANVPNPTTHDFYSGRVFHNFKDSNQLWVGYSYERKAVKSFGVGGTVLPEAGVDTHFFEHEINVGHTMMISPHMLNQLHFLVGKAENRTDSITDLPQTIVSGAFTGGGAQADAYRTENHFDGTDIVTYSRGKQELKFGIDVPDISRRAYVDNTNRLGTYTFASLSNYTGGTPSLFVTQRGQPRVVFWEKVFSGIFEDTIRLRSNLSFAFGVRYYFQNYFHDVPTNFAPRFSFAYAPSTRGRTILRGGAGLFYDRTGPSPISDLLHFNGVVLRKYIISQPVYPYPSDALVSQPTSVVELDPRSRIPSTLQYSFGVEEQITKSSTLSATYVGTRGMNLFRSIDANAPVAPTYADRPESTLGQLRLMQPEGYAKGNSLEVSLRGRPVPHFSGQVQYVLSKTYNDTQGITYFPGYSYTPLRDWSRSDNDRRHKFDMMGTFDAGKWFTLGTALSLYSGLPVNITTGSDTNRDGVAVDRPMGISRNAMHGPSYLDLDLNLAHDFPLSKDRKGGPMATLSLNSFNVLNQTNATTYVGVITSPFFGRSVSALPPRRMQLSLQIKF